MNKIKLFTDGSVNPQKKIGFAAYIKLLDENQNIQEIKKTIKLKKFEDTSSTKLELQALLWALEDSNEKNIIVYTDCQNILTLKERRKRFEDNNYYTKKGTLIGNHELYKKFYRLTDKLNCEFIKVKGHKQEDLKDNIDNIFTLVDKASRNALRELDF